VGEGAACGAGKGQGGCRNVRQHIHVHPISVTVVLVIHGSQLVLKVRQEGVQVFVAHRYCIAPAREWRGKGQWSGGGE
jgi:hypothetical protein